MPSLKTLIENKLDILAVETNLEQGSVWVHTGSPMNDDTHEFCWESPGTGTAIIEVWGPGGSGSTECCCSHSLPGNPSGYSKRTVTVNSNSYICGTTGCSTSGRDTNPGKGSASCISICHADGCNCICVQSGHGGRTFCTTGTPQKCCFGAAGYPCTPFSTYCSIICNICCDNTCCLACAFGGDINITGGISCKTFYNCNACCQERFKHHMQMPPGITSTCGSQVTVTVEMDKPYSAGPTGSNMANYQMALSTLSRNPTQGMQPHFCWNGARTCGCYAWHACRTMLPAGVPGISGTTCPGVISSGMRGGMGAVKIRFIG